ncbi:hypothetical protein V6N13_140916 [Hibiscus sabdariffa]|uniref:Uncharacterized protein n=1 Tax=Hibiscus sabdariffa TaxID=183260 RepID=A0ABR2Q1I3_9ROSI
MNRLTAVAGDTFTSLLNLATNNEVEGFKGSIEHDPSGVDEVGLWYGRQKGSKQMVNEERTPLMVASMYGSIDVILSSSNADVNRVCGSDKSTALHCAAAGGAVNVTDVVKLLLAAGADLRDVKLTLEELLATESSNFDLNSRVSALSSISVEGKWVFVILFKARCGHLWQASLSGRMSPRNVEPISPMSPRVSMLAQREKLQEFRSLSSRDLISGLAAIASIAGLDNGHEPDLSWFQSLVKESPNEIKEKIAATVSGEGSTMNSDPVDNAAALGAWLEQINLWLGKTETGLG